MGRPTPEGVAAMAVESANRAAAAAEAAAAVSSPASSSSPPAAHPPLTKADTVALNSLIRQDTAQRPLPPASHPPLTKEDTIAAHRLIRQETPLNHAPAHPPPLTHANTVNLSASAVSPLSPLVMLPTVSEADAAAGGHAPYSAHFASSQADQLLSELASLHKDTAPAAAPRFTKQLSSDLSPADCLALFLHLQSVSDLFVDFSAAELTALSGIFSVLRIAQGETIIRKGEEASFCGIVLQGRFQAVISPEVSVELRAGNLLGEMSIFESMTRSADIVTAEDSVLAVLTFEELDMLGSQQAPLLPDSPDAAEDAGSLATQPNLGVLQTKLLKMFAVASIRKLRATTQQTTEALIKANAALAAAGGAAGGAVPIAAQDGTAASSSSTVAVAAAAGDPAAQLSTALELNKDGRSQARNTSVARASMELTEASVAAASSSTLPPVASTAAQAAAATAETAAAPTESFTSDGAVAPTNVTSRESLYRVRLALERDKQSAHKEAEAERALRLKVEQKSLSTAAQFERFRSMSERLKSELQTHVARVADLAAETQAARAQQQKAEEALAQSIAEHDTLYARFSAEQDQRLAEQKAASEARELAETERAKELAAVRTELGQVLSRSVDLELEMDRNRKESASVRAAAAEKCVAAEATVAEAQARLEAQSGAVAAAQRLQKAAEDSVAGLAATVAQQTASLHLSRQALEEKSAEVQRLAPFKPKCVDLSAQLSREKQQHLQTVSAMFAQNSILEHRLARHRKMLLVVTSACYVKLYKSKKAARTLHLEISAVLCDILAGHIVAAGASSEDAQTELGMDATTAAAAAAAAAASGSGSSIPARLTAHRPSVHGHAHARTNSATGSVVSEEAASSSSAPSAQQSEGDAAPAASPSAALAQSSLVLRKALARKKKLYLESVLKRTRGSIPSHGTGSVAAAAVAGFRSTSSTAMSLADLLSSIEEEVLKLKGPFEAVQARALHWRVTGEKFFARSIELTGALLELRRTNAALGLQNATLQSLLDQHSAQQDGVLASNQALRMEVARFKHELGSARAAHKAAETERDVRGAKRKEVEAMDSRIAMQQAQLSFLQARYVETAEALQRLVAAATVPKGSDSSNSSGGGPDVKSIPLSTEPPPAGPHFPPVPPHVTSPTLTQLFASTLGIRFEGGAGVHHQSSKSFLPAAGSSADGNGSGIPASHEDPELYHSLSLQHFQAHEQQEMAMRELDKWRGVQFVLENSAAPARGKKGAGASLLQPSRSQARGFSRKSSPAAAHSSDPLVSSLSSLTEVSALQLRDNYASVREASDASLGSGEDNLDPLTGSPSRNAGLQHSRAQAEEESKQSLLSSQTARIRLVKNAMGRSQALGDTSALRSNNNFHSNLASRNSTEIRENGALHSVGSSPASAINGGAASPAAIAAAMSSYSSFAPVASTSEAAAPDYSRTLMLLKPFAATVASSGSKRGFGATGAHTATEGGGARDFADVYSPGNGAAGSTTAQPYPPPVPHSAASIHASAADLCMAPTGAYVQSAWSSPRAQRAPGQFASSTSLRSNPDASPRASRSRIVVASSAKSKSTAQGAASPPPQQQQPPLLPPLTPRDAQPILEQYFKQQQQQQDQAYAQAWAAHMWQQQQQQPSPPSASSP